MNMYLAMHSSILRWICLQSTVPLLFGDGVVGVGGFFSHNISDFQIIWPEHHWRDTMSKCASGASKLVSYEFYIKKNRSCFFLKST
jgi:hypothetical protein